MQGLAQGQFKAAPGPATMEASYSVTPGSSHRPCQQPRTGDHRIQPRALGMGGLLCACIYIRTHTTHPHGDHCWFRGNQEVFQTNPTLRRKSQGSHERGRPEIVPGDPKYGATRGPKQHESPDHEEAAIGDTEEDPLDQPPLSYRTLCSQYTGSSEGRNAGHTNTTTKDTH